MKMLRLAFKRDTAAPVLALLFASGVCLALILALMVRTANADRYGFLIWNLFLAWLPLLFALLAYDEYRTGFRPSWRFRSLAAAWLLFFPNAPYIFTDLFHLNARLHGHFWVDLVLILSCALTGLVLGFVSLYLMHGIVMRALGRAVSWLFVAGVAGLTGFGIYLGRFLRFNSWDVLFKPKALYHGIGHWAANPFGQPNSVAFPVVFATFLFIAYLMLYALTHLRHFRPLELDKGLSAAQ